MPRLEIFHRPMEIGSFPSVVPIYTDLRQTFVRCGVCSPGSFGRRGDQGGGNLAPSSVVGDSCMVFLGLQIR